MQPAADTIAAIATPAGHGGVGIVRVSGPQVPAIARRLLGQLPRPRHAVLHGFHAADGALIDEGLVLFFPAPASFTGEHVLELHGHGGPVVMDLLLQRVLQLGARSARAGEFSERAFLNDKLDLAQAEAIADLIDSATAQAARAAVRSLHGEFSARVHALQQQLTPGSRRRSIFPTRTSIFSPIRRSPAVSMPCRRNCGLSRSLPGRDDCCAMA
jgi:tRNA modification GTPase